MHLEIGDSNMHLFGCAGRNDAIGNVAVILYNRCIWYGSMLPDLIVAVIMATLGLTGGYQVIKKANQERKQHTASQPALLFGCFFS